MFLQSFHYKQIYSPQWVKKCNNNERNKTINEAQKHFHVRLGEKKKQKLKLRKEKARAYR